MVAEVLKAVAEEFSASPMRFVAELVQFLLLVGVGWVVAFGFGKRRGFVANMLAEHGTAVTERIGRASEAPSALAEAKGSAEHRVEQAKAEAERLRSEAHKESEAEEDQSRSQADDEAARIIDRARTALGNEREEMQAELRDELVALVSEATRSIMNEALTVAEQRERIETAIASSMDGSAGEDSKAGRRLGRQPAMKQA